MDVISKHKITIKYQYNKWTPCLLSALHYRVSWATVITIPSWNHHIDVNMNISVLNGLQFLQLDINKLFHWNLISRLLNICQRHKRTSGGIFHSFTESTLLSVSRILQLCKRIFSSFSNGSFYCTHKWMHI